VTFRFVRSRGAGGQNVNKTSTKAVLRWAVERSPSVSPAVRARFRARYGNRLTGSGDVVLTSDRFRDQRRNAADCLEKLQRMLDAVARPPTPRRATVPGTGARERRLREKRAAAERKRRRRPVGDDA
jgi:ribosome-associated protein